jgi:3-methyl-2-oxobutanoate hydroxymethyltransferase
MLTAYDYPTAQILDEAGIPILLVGDSLGQVLLGYDSTVRVTLDEMLHHTRAVARGARRALIVGDMPFLTYATPETALDSAGRFLRDGAQAVKIEGGTRSARTVETLVRAGVPVMGHIGWTPQSQGALGGKVRVQGRTRTQARQLLSDAYSIQEAGAFSIVLELVPEQLAGAITERLSIPTIGIGAGPSCSGQVQVITDLLGLGSFIPRHARPFADLRGTIRVAAESWAAEVIAGTFPGAVESVRMDDAVLAEALGRTALDRADESAITGSIPLDRDL